MHTYERKAEAESTPSRGEGQERREQRFEDTGLEDWRAVAASQGMLRFQKLQ